MPTGVVAPTTIVMSELPEPGAGIVEGLKLTVVPVGAPVAVKLIALLNPPLMAEVIVLVPWLPWPTLTELGAADRVKLGGTVTVRVTVAVC